MITDSVCDHVTVHLMYGSITCPAVALHFIHFQPTPYQAYIIIIIYYVQLLSSGKICPWHNIMSHKNYKNHLQFVTSYSVRGLAIILLFTIKWVLLHQFQVD